MKKRAAIRAGVAIATVVAAIAGATALTTWAKPSPAPFATLSDADLVARADKGELGADADRPYEVATELWNRRTTMNRQDMIKVITDARHPHATRSLMIEVLAGPRPDAKADDDARALLDDPRLDGELKARVLVSYQFDRGDIPQLRRLATSSEDVASFHALKALMSVDKAAAADLAKDVLASPSGRSDLKLSSAYKAIIRSGVLAQDPDGQTKLVGHLTGVLRDPGASRALKDSALFGLIDLGTPESMAALLASDADPAMLSGAVDERAQSLLDALNASPDERTIAMVVTAMEIRPIKELAQPLRDAAPAVKQGSLRTRILKVVDLIDREGSPINPKWSQR